MNKKIGRKIFTKQNGLILAGLMLSFGLGVIIDHYMFPRIIRTPAQSCVEKLYVDNVYQDEEMKSILINDLGIHPNNIQGLELKPVDDADGVRGRFRSGHSVNCVAEKAPEIQVLKDLDHKEKREVLAHEFVHYYYSRPWFEYARLATEQDLILLYKNNLEIQSVYARYVASGALTLSEILAYSCVSLPEQDLPNSVIGVCNDILPNRHILNQ